MQEYINVDSNEGTIPMEALATERLEALATKRFYENALTRFRTCPEGNQNKEAYDQLSKTFQASVTDPHGYSVDVQARLEPFPDLVFQYKLLFGPRKDAPIQAVKPLDTEPTNIATILSRECIEAILCKTSYWHVLIFGNTCKTLNYLTGLSARSVCLQLQLAGHKVQVGKLSAFITNQSGRQGQRLDLVTRGLLRIRHSNGKAYYCRYPYNATLRLRSTWSFKDEESKRPDGMYGLLHDAVINPNMDMWFEELSSPAKKIEQCLYVRDTDDLVHYVVIDGDVDETC